MCMARPGPAVLFTTLNPSLFFLCLALHFCCVLWGICFHEVLNEYLLHFSCKILPNLKVAPVLVCVGLKNTVPVLRSTPLTALSLATEKVLCGNNHWTRASPVEVGTILRTSGE